MCKFTKIIDESMFLKKKRNIHFPPKSSHSDPKFVSDRVFIYLTIAETYFFVIFYILVAYAFFRTFNFSNFSKITDLYLKNIRRIVRLEKNQCITDDEAELLVMKLSVIF